MLLARGMRGATVRQRLVWTIAAWSSWQLLLGPGTERLTYILLAPAVAWGMVASYAARRGRLWITLAFATTYIFDFGSLERIAAGVWPIAMAVQPCGVLLFVGWLLRYGSLPELWPDCAALPEPAAKLQINATALCLQFRRPNRTGALCEIVRRFFRHSERSLTLSLPASPAPSVASDGTVSGI